MIEIKERAFGKSETTKTRKQKVDSNNYRATDHVFSNSASSGKSSKIKEKDFETLFGKKEAEEVKESIIERYDRMKAKAKGDAIFEKLNEVVQQEKERQRQEEEQKKYLLELERIRKQIEEEKQKKFEEFKKKQQLRNEEIRKVYFKLDEWEIEIAKENGIFEPETIPAELLEMNELTDKLEEYNRIIEDAEKEVRKKLIKGYDDFLNMLTHTILPDLNDGFMDNLKEAFRDASLGIKSEFLENWWKEMREKYEDIHSGSETIWGIEIQQDLAQGMLDFLKYEGVYEDTWNSEPVSNEE